MIEPALLAEAARAYLRIEDACRLCDLKDWLRDAGREHHEGDTDRKWHARLNAGFLAGDFRELTGLDWEAAQAAISEAMAPDWPTIACKEIISFAERFIDQPPAEPSNRKPAPKQKKPPLC